MPLLDANGTLVTRARSGYGVAVDGGLLLPERIEGDGVLLRRWLVTDAEALAAAVTESDEHLRPWWGGWHRSL